MTDEHGVTNRHRDRESDTRKNLETLIERVQDAEKVTDTDEVTDSHRQRVIERLRERD